jgi:hypothetical protein
MNHSSYQIKLFNTLGLLSGCWRLSKLITDLFKSFLPIFLLDEVDNHVIIVFSDIDAAESNVRQVGLVALLAANTW